MNRIVDLWDKHQERPKYNGPDSIKIDDETEIQFEGDVKMSLDTSLDKTQFRNLVRAIKNMGLDRVKNIRTVSFESLKRLKVKRDLTKAVKGIPKGSDQYSEAAVFNWLRKVGPTNKRAVSQVIAIDATAVSRMNV